jgi:basic amino acid/polyamine antiporter, APA family
MTEAPDPAPSRLARKLRLKDAVVLGLGSMIGAGVFAAIGPAARAAGSGLLLGLVIAASIAWLNATSMARLAALHPQSGGAYVYGRLRLGPFWGFLAGWGFIIGKLASCAAMAMTFAHYALPHAARPAAVGAVLALTIVNTLGVQKTAWMTRILVTLVLVALAIVVAASLGGGAADPSRLTPIFSGGVRGTLQAGGLLFFAFAGYARIATLGEEVVDPAKTIPRAIPLALGIAFFVYASVMVTALACVGADGLAASQAPLATAVESGRFAHLSPVVRAGAAVGSLGVLLSLLAGIGRTTFAMASNRDLPHVLAAVHPRFQVPHRAEIAAGLIVACVAGLADIRSAIGFSSFAILIYYAIANASAVKLVDGTRRTPRALALLGLFSCLLVAMTLPSLSVLAGAGVLGAGALVYALRRRMKSAELPPEFD